MSSFKSPKLKGSIKKPGGTKKQKWVSQVEEITWKCHGKEMELFIVWERKGKDRNEYFPANKLRFKSIPGVKENKKGDYTLNITNSYSKIVAFKDVQHLGKIWFLDLGRWSFCRRVRSENTHTHFSTSTMLWWKIIIFLIGSVRFRITLFWSSSIIACLLQ